MPDEFEYDLFLSHANEDKLWCEGLAERLRNEGVRVWFDRWQIQPGHNISDRINEGLEKSRRLVTVWTENYFADHKVWTLAESYATQHQDVLGRERLLIPLLRRDCAIKPTLRGLLHIDFRNDTDFELRFRQLLEALGASESRRRPANAEEFRKLELSPAERGNAATLKGKRFEEEVATLYRVFGFDVKQDIQLYGIQIDLLIEKKEAGLSTQAIVECKDKRITATERDQILAQQNVAQRKMPNLRWIAISSIGFAAETRTALEASGIVCITYSDLLLQLVPLGNYVDGLVAQIENEINDPEKGWGGRDLFIRPDLETDVTYEKLPALTHFAKWLGDDRANLLVVLGDLGAGKTTLSRFLAYQLARSFRDDPLRHPAPVLIPLREVRKEVAFDSIIIKHFRDRGLHGLNFPRFEHLLRKGRIVLFFDAFDEMADRVRWEVTQGNFQELRRAAESAGKVILTCRTHYFRDRAEQVRLISQGPSLTASETALYKELRQQSNAEVVYLQEFSDVQIREYLDRARGAEADGDWRKIQDIYNLRDLAHRPLLLDMIVKTLPRLRRGEQVNAANLYSVYTNIWIDRDFAKGRVVLNRETKVALMTELAWQMWSEEKNSFSTSQLTKFLERHHAAGTFEFGDQEAEDITREVQAASFLRRDHKGGSGDFQFIHRSFGEFFLAKRILQSLQPTHSLPSSGGMVAEGRSPLQVALNTRRLDRKIIFFLTLLDEKDAICLPLQQILIGPYTPNVSENALQILYWSGRVQCEAEEKIKEPEKLTAALAARLPVGIQLAGAELQEIVLEQAGFTSADFSGADLTKGNLNGIQLTKSNFSEAILRDARISSMVAKQTKFSRACMDGLYHSHLQVSECDFSGTPLERLGSSWRDRLWMDDATITRVALLGNLQPTVQLGSSATITSIAWHKQNGLLALAGGDVVIRLYRPNDGRLVRVLEGHRKAILSLAFDPAGQTLASASADGTVKIWEPTGGKLLRTLGGHEDWVQTVAFDPTGPTLASGAADGAVRLWEPSSGKLLRTLKGHENGILSVAFDPSGQILASGSVDKTINLWNPSTGEVVRTLRGHENGVQSLEFDPSGQTLASGSFDTMVKLWDPATGKLLRTLEGHQNRVESVAFDPSGHTLASGSTDRTVKRWERFSGKLLHTFEGHQDWVRSVAFGPGGQTLASGSADKTLKLWDSASGKLLRTVEGQDSVQCVAFDPNGRTVASGGVDNTVRLWERSSGKLLHTLKGHQNRVQSVAFHPSGEIVASGSEDSTVKVWQRSSGKLLLTLEVQHEWLQSVAFDPTGNTLATAGSDNKVRIWDWSSGKVLHVLEDHEDWIRCMAFHPKGQTLATGSDDKTVKLWEDFGGRPLFTLEGHEHWVRSVAFDPGGQTLATGSDDTTVRLWDRSNGKLLFTLEGHQDGVPSVAFDPSGQTLVSASYDTTVKLWDRASGRLLTTLEGHGGPVFAVAFAPKGKYIIAAGASGRLQFWDVRRRETFLYSYAFGPGAWLLVLPDGRFDGTPDALRYLCYTEQGTLNSFTAEELQNEFYAPQAVQEVLSRYNS